MSGRRVLVVGEALIDIVRRPDREDAEHVGGSPANVAMGLARLEAPVEFATSLGRDERGERVAAHLADHGVRLSPGSVGDHPTSTALADIDSTGAATYAFDLHWEPGRIEVPDDAGHVHTGSIGAVIAPGADDVTDVLVRAGRSCTVSYDPNVRPTIMGDLEDVRTRVEEVVGLSDVVKASEDDLVELYPGRRVEDVLRRWTERGAALAVVTRAGDGVTYRVGGTDEVVTLPAPETEVVDTVGAGDSFMAGMLSGLLDAGHLGGVEARGRLRAASAADLRPAIERGLACGARTVSRAGAYAPGREEVTS